MLPLYPVREVSLLMVVSLACLLSRMLGLGKYPGTYKADELPKDDLRTTCSTAVRVLFLKVCYFNWSGANLIVLR